MISGVFTAAWDATCRLRASCIAKSGSSSSQSLLSNCRITNCCVSLVSMLTCREMQCSVDDVLPFNRSTPVTVAFGLIALTAHFSTRGGRSLLFVFIDIHPLLLNHLSLQIHTKPLLCNRSYLVQQQSRLII